MSPDLSEGRKQRSARALHKSHREPSGAGEYVSGSVGGPVDLITLFGKEVKNKVVKTLARRRGHTVTEKFSAHRLEGSGGTILLQDALSVADNRHTAARIPNGDRWHSAHLEKVAREEAARHGTPVMDVREPEPVVAPQATILKTLDQMRRGRDWDFHALDTLSEFWRKWEASQNGLHLTLSSPLPLFSMRGESGGLVFEGQERDLLTRNTRKFAESRLKFIPFNWGNYATKSDFLFSSVDTNDGVGDLDNMVSRRQGQWTGIDPVIQLIHILDEGYTSGVWERDGVLRFNPYTLPRLRNFAAQLEIAGYGSINKAASLRAEADITWRKGKADTLLQRAERHDLAGPAALRNAGRILARGYQQVLDRRLSLVDERHPDVRELVVLSPIFNELVTTA
jgi:hypothetical protein